MGFFDDVATACNLPVTEKGIPNYIVLSTNEKGEQQRPYLWDDFPYAYHTCVWIYACSDAISRNAAGRPLTVQKNVPGGVERVSFPLFDDGPNPYYSIEALIESTMGYLELTGNAYWEKVGGEQPTELYCLRPDKMTILGDPKTYIKGYIFNKDEDNEVRYEPEEIIHFRYFDPLNEYYGMPALKPLKLSIETDVLSMRWNKNFFLNNARPDGFLIAPPEYGTLDPDQLTQMRTEWEKAYGTVDKAHKIAILSGGVEYKQVSLAQSDIQFLEGRKSTREDIMAAMGVPPTVVGLPTANYAQAKEEKKTFWQETMIPKLRKLSVGMRMFLLKDFGEDLFCDFDLTDVEALKEDETVIIERCGRAITSGQMTQDEARAKRGKPPMVSGGNILYMPVGLVPVGQVSEETETPKSVSNPFKELAEQFDNVGLLIGKQDPLEISVDTVETILFDMDSEKARFIKAATPEFAEIMRETWEDTIAQLVLDLQFDIQNPMVRSFLQNKVFKFSDEVLTTQKKRLRKALIEGLDEQETLEQISARIQGVFEGTVRGSAPRSMMIARTEAPGAVNQTILMVYEQSGTLAKKSWLSMRDSNVRASHRAAEAIGPISMEAKFPVGAYMMNAPHDPTAGAEEVVNCRCTIVAEAVTEQTEEWCTARWQKFDRWVIEREQRFANMLKGLFAEQEREILTRLQEMLG